MQGASMCILLQEQCTRALGEIWILLDYDPGSQSRYYFSSREAIISQFVITVLGNSNFALRGQSLKFVMK